MSLVLELVKSLLASDWTAFTQTWIQLSPQEQRHLSGFISALLKQNAPLQTVDMLLQSGCDFEEINEEITEYTPLLLACDLEMEAHVELLLKYGANVQAKALNSNTEALHIACSRGNIKLVEILIEYGCDVEEQEISPLMFLCAPDDKSSTIVRLLVSKGIKVDQVNCNGQTALSYALIQDLYKCAEELLLAGANVHMYGRNSQYEHLHILASRGKKIDDICRVATLLLERGANVNATCANGLTPIVYACKTAWRYPLVELLLKNGAEVNEEAFVAAVSCQATSSLELLLQAGADANAVYNGIPMLTRAIDSGHLPTVLLLAKAGADVNTYNKQSNMDIDNILLQFGANIPYGEKPPRLTEEDLKMEFLFTFCAQCRSSSNELNICAGCKLVAYCDTECQRKHWKHQHKRVCKQKQAADERARRL